MIVLYPPPIKTVETIDLEVNDDPLQHLIGGRIRLSPWLVALMTVGFRGLVNQMTRSEANRQQGGRLDLHAPPYPAHRCAQRLSL